MNVAGRITASLTAARARRAARALRGVTFDDTTGQVCDTRCRSAAHYDRTRTAAYRAL